MVKVYCDICGAEIDNTKSAFIFIVKAPQIRSWEDDGLYTYAEYQICKNCAKAVAKALAPNKIENAWE